MALIDDLFAENILDEPDDLEQVEEAEVYEDVDVNEDQENTGTNDEKEANGEKKDEKKKRKTSQKPKLNILRLMDSKKGLTSVENFFKNTKFKGKHHEQEDLNLIMRRLEIWTHQLYPSMQFDDCLEKLEKLGSNKSVMTFVKKIRMGLEVSEPKSDEIVMDSDDNENDIKPTAPIGNDPFDQLISSQNIPVVSQPTNAPSGLTAEQRERMLRNRLIAEQRRMARMKARLEQQQEQVPCEADIDKETSEGSENSKVAGSISSETENSIETSNDNTVQLFNLRNQKDDKGISSQEPMTEEVPF